MKRVPQCVKQHELPLVCVAIRMLRVEGNCLLKSLVGLSVTTHITKFHCGHSINPTVCFLELFSVKIFKLNHPVI